MRVTTIVFLLVLTASAQSTPKGTPHKAAPASMQMSHDFRTAGRRAIAAINDLGWRTTSVLVDLDKDVALFSKAADAITEADAQHDNAVDKKAVKLLREYNSVTLDAVQDREAVLIQAKAAQLGSTSSGPPSWCSDGACQAMYKTCKKEAEEAFETGVMPAKVQCKSLSPPDSK